MTISAKLCKFETALNLVSKNKPDWLFLGIECDDNCVGTQVNEGLYCHKDGTIGYYEIENGQLGNPLNKIEFNEAECSFSDVESKLSVDRYMPNLWLRNQEIVYYISNGMQTIDFVNKPPDKFTVTYGDKDQIVSSNANKNGILSLVTLSTVLASVYIILF